MMYSVFSSYKKILDIIVTVIVISMLALYPTPFATAQEIPAEEQATATEEAVDPPDEEPPQEDGEDGSDGESAPDGVDGTSPNDPPTDPEPGDDGEDVDVDPPLEDGDTGGEEENNTADEDTTIDTGDATSEGGINNYVDLSILKTLAEEAGIDLPPLYLYYIYFDREEGKYKTSDPSRQDELDEALLDGLLDPQEYLQIVTPEEDVMASTTNDAIVENEAEITAGTGENSASNNENVTINTGDAVAVANILNVVNTNIFDSEGFFLFLDNLGAGGVQGNLDFRDFDFFNPSSVQESTDSRESSNPITAICPTCGGTGDLTINVGQNAEITNDVVVRSGTGLNVGLNNSGDTTINTGDAYAVANVINLANTNIVDSNYLLLTFNNFGDYNSDIVFPGAEEFLEMFKTGGQTTPSSVNINNTSTTGVDNNTDVTGETGDNIARETNGGGSIGTGDANASNNTLNQINSNLFGGSSFSILVKVHGEWDGEVVGIPEDMTWRETPEGIELMYDSEGSSCDSSGPCNAYDAINVTTNNATQITNNISVLALTGENKIEGAGGEAEINTGDAFAAANTINIANTNVIGKNWMMAVINIFGDWTGNITFGQPNLWVGAKAIFSNGAAEPGTEFEYEYTVMNTGDAPATNVCLRNRFDHRLVQLTVQSPATDRVVTSGDVEYCIGTIGAGEVREFSRGARISEHLGYGTTYITNDIEVTGGGNDPILDDNFETVTFDISIARPDSARNGGTRIEYTPSPKLSISKVNASPFFVRASSTVNYRIIVKNTGAGSAYNAVLIDTLYDDDGNKVYEEFWNLEEIYAGEYIEIFYTTFFNEASEPGEYRNEARIEALGGYHTFMYGYDASTETVESTIKVVPNPNLINGEEIIEIIGESKGITETIDESIIEDVIDEEEEDINFATVTKTGESATVFGPYHGPLYYEHDNDELPTISKILAVIFDHPQFTSHPVNLAALGTFDDISLQTAPKNEVPNVLGEYVGHPLFTQHPVDIRYSYFNNGWRGVASFPWTQDLIAETGYMKFLSLPFGDISYNNIKKDEDEKNTNTLAFLALSMFIIGKPLSRQSKKD